MQASHERLDDTGYEALFRLSPLGILIGAADGVLVDANDAAARLLGLERRELMGRVPRDLGLRAPELSEPEMTSLAPARDFELALLPRNGTRRHLSVAVYPLELAGNTRIITTLLDVTERRRAENEQRQAQAKFSGFLEAAPDAVVIANHAGEIVMVNAQTERIFGYPRSELLGQAIEILIPDRFRIRHPQHRGSYMVRPRVRPMHASGELFGRRRDGREFPVEVSLSPLETEDGVLVCSAIRDVTAPRRTEGALREALKEKEVLLQEIHHRVKNNLQVIVSLINMQRRRLESTAARDALTEYQGRVQAIALIHEQLYAANDYSRVLFSEYLRTLANNVFHAFGVSTEKIALALEIEAIELPVARAIPCGLIVTELITNAFEHAFPDDRRGTVRVVLQRSQGEIRLEIGDDGVGLTADFELSAPETLGLQLVSALAEQLQAKIVVSRERGAQFRVTFAVEE